MISVPIKILGFQMILIIKLETNVIPKFNIPVSPATS